MLRVSLCIALFLVSCGGDERPAAPPEATVEPARMIATPRGVLAKCTRLRPLRPACPTRVPYVEDSGFERASSSGAPPPGLWTFFAEWNAPYEGLTRKNAPPRFTHVNVFAGDISQMTPFEVEGALRGPPQDRRDAALSLGMRTWNDREGELLLAPSYPVGGMEGDHLIFRWEQDGRDFSLSIHAWKPLGEAEATLQEMAESLP